MIIERTSAFKKIINGKVVQATLKGTSYLKDGELHIEVDTRIRRNDFSMYVVDMPNISFDTTESDIRLSVSGWIASEPEKAITHIREADKMLEALRDACHYMELELRHEQNALQEAKN